MSDILLDVHSRTSSDISRLIPQDDSIDSFRTPPVLALLIAYLVNGIVSEVTALVIHIKEQINFRIFSLISLF